MPKKSKKIKGDKINHVVMEEEFNNFQGFEDQTASSSNNTTSNKKKKLLSDNVLSTLQRLLVVIFLLIVFTRKDFFTAFGTGTGVSKAHVSPLSVTTRFLETTKFNKKNYRFRTIQKKMITNMAYVGEIVNSYVDKESVLTKKKRERLEKKKKKNKNKKNKRKGKKNMDDTEDMYWENAEKWYEKTRSDRSLRRVVDRNYFLCGGAILCILFAFLALFVPDVVVMSLFGFGSMFAGANNQNSPTRPETMAYIAMAVLFISYALGQLKGDGKKKSRRPKKKKKKKKEKLKKKSGEEKKKDK